MTDFNFKIQADIYCLDPEKFEGNEAEYIENIVNSHSSSSSNYAYTLVDLKTELSDELDWNIQLYLSRDIQTPPDWKEFILSLIPIEQQSSFDYLKRKYPSFMLFFFSEGAIYVVTKGAGRYAIQNKIMEGFGIAVLERVIDSARSEIKSANEISVFGDIIAQEKHFRANVRLSDDRSIAKFYKQVSSFIPKAKLSSQLGVETDKTSLVVSGENTLKINNKITIKELDTRISKVHALLLSDRTYDLNKFKQLKKNKLDEVVSGISLQNRLELQLMKDTLNQFRSGQFIEIYHPDIFEFLKAEGLYFYHDPEQVKRKSTAERLSLQIVFDDLGLVFNDDEQFFHSLQYTFGGFELEEEFDFNTARNLLSWISGEVVLDERKYFRFDGKWYTYEESFLDEIETNINLLIQELGTEKHLHDWPYSEIKAM